MKLRPVDIEPTPDVFATVMATGIVSIAARDHHYTKLSGVLGVLATLGFAVLVAVVIAAAAARSRKLFWDLADPDITLRLFTFVAACAVLDTRLSFNLAMLRVLGVVALLAWVVLMVLTVRNMAAHRWAALRDHAHGAWELASVGTSGLAIVMGQISYYSGHRLWLLVAVPVWSVAIGIYVLMTWLILWRAIIERGDRDGFAPDSWIMRMAGGGGAGHHRRHLGGGHAVDTAVDLLRIAPHHPTARRAAVHRCLVVTGVPAGHVLGGHRCHGSRARCAVDAYGFVGVLLGCLRGVADRGGRRAVASAAHARRSARLAGS